MTATRWQITGRAVKFFSQLTISVLLARLLTPADFGIMALCLLVVGFAARLSTVGLGAAVVQRLEVTRRHLQAGLAVLLLLGTTGTLAIFFLSPSLSRLLGIPEAALPLRVLSPILLINAWPGLGRTLLVRQLDFRKIFVIDFASHLLGYGAVGVSGAFLGWGVWALVGSAVVQGLVACILTIRLARPPLVPRLGRLELQELGAFGLKVTLVRLTSFAVSRVDQLVVSKILGPVALGLYERSLQIIRLPEDFLGLTLGSILFSAASRIQADRLRVARVYQKASISFNLLLLPAIATLFVLSPEIIESLFGDQWLESILPARILLLATVFRAQDQITSAFLRALGLLRILVINELLMLGLIGILSWPAAQAFGLVGVASVVAGTGSLCFVLKTGFALKALQARIPWTDHARIFGTSVLVGLLVVAGRLAAAFLTDSSLLHLIAGCTVAGSSTVLLLRTPLLIGAANYESWGSLVSGLSPFPWLVGWLIGQDPKRP